jgi:hypothetical protein
MHLWSMSHEGTIRQGQKSMRTGTSEIRPCVRACLFIEAACIYRLNSQGKGFFLNSPVQARSACSTVHPCSACFFQPGERMTAEKEKFILPAVSAR